MGARRVRPRPIVLPRSSMARSALERMPRFLLAWWLYPSSRRSSLPGRTRFPYGLFGETSHVVKSRRQRSIIEHTRRPFSFDNKASITEDLDPPALLRRPRFGSKEGAVRHEFVGAAHSSLLAFSSSQWPSQTPAPAKSGHSPTAANGSIDRRSIPSLRCRLARHPLRLGDLSGRQFRNRHLAVTSRPNEALSLLRPPLSLTALNELLL